MLLSGESFMWASAASALILLFSGMGGVAQKAPKTTIGQWLGKISYSLYLIHNPITGAAAFMVHRVVGRSVLSDVFTLIFAVIASVAASYIMWRLIELPSHRWARKVPLQKD